MSRLLSSCACCADLLHHRFDRRRFLQVGAATALAAALPTFAAVAAEGQYDAMLLNCIDPRFQTLSDTYLDGRQMRGKYSQFTIAGASIGVVAPSFKTWAPAFWDNLAASMQLHRIPKVIVVNHRDCGAARIAYGADAVKDKAAETATHKTSLMEFQKQLAERQPSLKAELHLMALDGTLETFS